jgi:hypothetical protein
LPFKCNLQRYTAGHDDYIFSFDHFELLHEDNTLTNEETLCVDARMHGGGCTSAESSLTPSLQQSRASNSSYCFVRFASLPDIA